MMTTALFLAALLVLPALYARDSIRERRRRGGWFADVLPLFDSYHVTQQSQSWPVLTGRYQGVEVRLEPVLDDMAWRKLPSLWLKATVLAPNPARGTLGFLVRARGGEFYSPTAEMAHRLPIPKAFPSDAMLCSDCAETAPLRAVESQIDAFGDPRMKELVITPKGVRLVYQAAQGERADYLVLRQARFAQDKGDTTLVKSLLDRAMAIVAAVDAPAQQQVAA
ncbi:MAG TPA: hypothetical protein VLL04_00575 [Rhizomicrobium sp.]|nr:hypothetical protein [Rhizomicrobium sp.]